VQPVSNKQSKAQNVEMRYNYGSYSVMNDTMSATYSQLNRVTMHKDEIILNVNQTDLKNTQTVVST